ncbi:hypothetical protein FRX31_008756 [Thalictrum thalictroides]|uniref:Uncharacterized protein n=1 Tax=Thalictrum thalictroides TaxID=46969 RepID=A0A7J6WXM0_THATH|nr:hypothetical protein FRX31_008756 [Thalictrum thalictroides]
MTHTTTSIFNKIAVSILLLPFSKLNRDEVWANNPNPEHHHFLSVPHFPCITSTPMMSDDDAEEPEDPKAVVAFSIPDLAPGMR